jgi:lipid-A-disaccharide synthase-like uncharacterized protein
VHRRDPIFVLLQACTLASAIVILVLAHRYRGMACEFHALTRLYSDAREGGRR